MSNKKKSSIDWLLKKIWWEYRLIPNDDIIEEAKAMHKEEIKEAYRCGAAEIGMIAVNKPEQYYNETFGDEKEML